MLRSHRKPHAVLVFPDKETAEKYDRALAFAYQRIDYYVACNANRYEISEGKEMQSYLHELRLQIGAIKERG